MAADGYDGTAKIAQAGEEGVSKTGFEGPAESLPKANEDGTAEEPFDGTAEITQARLPLVDLLYTPIQIRHKQWSSNTSPTGLTDNMQTEYCHTQD